MDFLEPAPAPTEPVLDAILDAVPDTVEEKTLRSLLDGDDDRPAVRITDGHAYSRQTLRREVASVAQQLARLGSVVMYALLRLLKFAPVQCNAVV